VHAMQAGHRRRHRYWNIKGCGDAARFFASNSRILHRESVWRLLPNMWPRMWHIRKPGKTDGKPRTERSLLFPSEEFRERVRNAAKVRGFPIGASVHSRCLPRMKFEGARIPTRQPNLKLAWRPRLRTWRSRGRGLQTLAHAQVALTDVFLKYVITL